MKKLNFLGAMAIAVALFSCSTVPITGRKQFNVVGDAEINQSAAASYRQLLNDPKTKVIASTADAQRVQRVGNQLATAIQRYLQQNGYANQYNFDWQFTLIQSSEVNACACPAVRLPFIAAFYLILKTMPGWQLY